MIPCISVSNMRDSDAFTIQKYVPSLTLMQRAAMGVYRAVNWHGRVAIVVGSGNNGGDGYALAGILKEQQIDCTVYAVSPAKSEDCVHYALNAIQSGVPVYDYQPGCLAHFPIIVDCLLGTGFRGNLKAAYWEAIEEINGSGAYVVSVDINSGMNGESGEAETAVLSDLTVTIGYVKNGLIHKSAQKYIKQLVCADIGIRLLKTENWIYSREEWIRFCSEIHAEPDKGFVMIDGNLHFPSPSWLILTPILSI